MPTTPEPLRGRPDSCPTALPRFDDGNPGDRARRYRSATIARRAGESWRHIPLGAPGMQYNASGLYQEGIAVLISGPITHARLA